MDVHTAREYLQVCIREMTEAALQSQIIALGRYHGFTLAYHTWNSQRSTAGFPDLVMVSPRQRRVLYRELKREKGRVTPDQQAWIDALTAAGQDVCVWRPSHLFGGDVEASLKGAPA